PSRRYFNAHAAAPYLCSRSRGACHTAGLTWARRRVRTPEAGDRQGRRRSPAPAGARLRPGRGARGVFVEAEGLAPAALPRLRKEAGHAGDFRVIEVADADLVVGRQQIEGRAHASKIVGARDT